MIPSDPDRHTLAPDGRPPEEQPQWRRDFPIDGAEDRYVARREFVKFMVLTSAAFVAGQLWILAKSLRGRGQGRPPEKLVGRLSEIPVGGFRVFDYPGPDEPRLLVRLDERRLVAFDQRCTHLSCPVIPRVAAGELDCPCHHGKFDVETGRPLAGPPRRPLPRIELEVRGDLVFAVGVEARTT